MLEPSLSVLVLLTLAATLVYLVAAGKRLGLHDRKGWRLTVTGFGLILAGVTIRVITTLPGDVLGHLSIDRDTVMIVETLFFYVCGGALVSVGIAHWLPALVAAGKTEAALQELSTERQLIFDTVPIGIIFVAGRELIRANTFVANLFGWDLDELQQMQPHASLAYPTQEAFEKVGEAAYGVMATGGTFHAEREMRRKDGSLFWCRMQGVAIDPTAPHDGSIWIFEDIGERRRVEENLVKAQHAAKIGYFEYFPKTDENLWSDGMFEVLGLESGSVTPTSGFLGQFMPGKSVEEFKRRLASGETSFGAEVEITPPGGRRRIITVEISVERDENGAATRLLGTAQDITEHRMAANELRLAKEAAEEANRTKTEFLANMSHELRTPLNSIIGFSEALTQGRLGALDPEKYIEYARDINQSGTHLLALINDILDVSVIESGNLELDQRQIDVGAMCDGLRFLVQGRSRKAKVELTLDVPPDLPFLRADERRMKQILINLLGNAVKFTPEGGAATLTVRVDDEGCFVFSVADNGIGIAPEDLQRVQTPFVQVNGTAAKEQGTGLGLPLTKSLIEHHGGTFSLESEPGVGTTATLRLPAARTVPRG